MPNGETGAFHYWDDIYSGTGCRTCDSYALSGGVGKLTDGVLGGNNWGADPQHWIGWRIQPTITFDFGTARSLGLLRIHSNNAQHGGVYLWDSLIVEFSADGVSFDNAANFTTSAAQRSDLTARFIDVPVPSRTARFVRLRFSHAAEWMFLSEIEFHGPDSPDPTGGLVSWWPGNGDVNDVVGGNNGTLQNGTTFATGKLGEAFSFNGAGAMVSVPDSSILNIRANLTVAAWFNLTGIPVNFPALVTKGPTNAQYLIFVEALAGAPSTSSALCFRVNLGPDNPTTSAQLSTRDVCSVTRVAYGQFIHVAGTYDGSTLKIYINGVLESTAGASGRIASDARPLTFGAADKALYGPGKANFVHGLIDEVRIYDRALTDPEINCIASSSAACGVVADLTVSKTHAGNFVQGQTNATYVITASNVGGASSTGQVSVIDTLPPGLTATDISGPGWNCTLSSLVCTRVDALAAGSSYPTITLTVNVASDAPSSITNTVTVSGGGDTNAPNNSANDVTVVNPTAVAPTIAVTGGTFIYDGLAHAATASATGASGAPVSGSFTFTYLPGGASAPINVGTYTVTADFTSSDPKYSNASGTASVTIAPRMPLVAVTGGTFPYDGSAHPATATATGVSGAPVPGSLTVVYTPGGSAPPVAVGAYSVTAAFTSSDPNYVSVTRSGSITIAAARPTITVAGGPFVYDGLPHGATATATRSGGAPVAGAFSITYTPGGAAAPIGIGTYAVTVTFTSADPNFTSVAATGLVAINPTSPLALVTLATDRSVYMRGQVVRLSGRVTSLNGSPVPNIPVVVTLSNNGVTRTFNPYTSATGDYQVTYQPAPTEGGLYSATTVVTIGGVTQTASASFRIVGFIVTPPSLTLDQVMGSEVPVALELLNVGDAALGSVNSSVTVNPAGALTANVSPVSTLTPGNLATLALTLAAPAGIPPPTSVSVQVRITATDPVSGTVDERGASIVVTLRPAVSSPTVIPATLSVGVNPGGRLTRRFLVRNDGYVSMSGATVRLRDPAGFNWVTLGNADLGDLLAGDAREFQVIISPPADLPVGNYPVVFDVMGGTTPLSGTLNVSVTELTAGTASFVVNNDTGAKVNGASITLYNTATRRTFQGVAGADGHAELPGVDAGTYSYVVAAPLHESASGTVTVTANATVSVPVILSFDVVRLTFTVTPTTIVDVYNVTLNVTYSTTLPKPALQVAPYALELSFFPEDVPDGRFACNLEISNTHPTASVRNLRIDASGLDATRPSGERIRVLFADGSPVASLGNLAGKGTTRVPCVAVLDGGGVSTHEVGSILVQGDYDFSLDGQLLPGTTTTKVPVSYVRPDELSYDSVPFIYDLRTDPANPVLRYDAGSFVYRVKNNRDQTINLPKPGAPIFNGHNLVAFTDTQGGSTSLAAIAANASNAFWRTGFQRSEAVVDRRRGHDDLRHLEFRRRPVVRAGAERPYCDAPGVRPRQADLLGVPRSVGGCRQPDWLRDSRQSHND